MKKKYLILAILPFLGLISCSGSNVNDNAPTGETASLNQMLLHDLKDNEVLLNLTVNGLYNGEKGEASETYYLENYVVVELNVGDALPDKDTITSTVADCEFTSWQYATSEGELAFVSKVQEGQKYYQAYFTYLGDGETDETIGGDNLSSETVADRTIYVKNEVGWSKVNAYAWNDYRAYNWPGIEMEYDDTIGLFTHELSSSYANIIFNNGTDQTADLKLYDNVNTYIIGTGASISYGWFENGNITPVTPSSGGGNQGGSGSGDGSGSTVYVNLNGAVNWSSVYIYSWNDSNSSLLGAWPGSKMEFDNETGYYKYTSNNITLTNVIFSNGNGTQTADLIYNSAKPVFQFNTVGQTSGVWTEIGENVEVTVASSDYYLRGSMNGWGTTDAMLPDGNGKYTITKTLTSGDEFKFASADWSKWEVSTLSGSAASNFSGGNGQNLKCNVTGTYSFVLDPSSNTITVTVA